MLERVAVSQELKSLRDEGVIVFLVLGLLGLALHLVGDNGFENPVIVSL